MLTLARDVSLQMHFSGHETFAFRYGWLKKGADAVSADPLIFTHEDALVRLGVGKNMVRSIRYWCLAMGLVEEDDTVPNNRGRALRLTPIGTALLGSGGWDPYLEDPASLFLLHWHLIRSAVPATTWHLGFLVFREPSFRKADLKQFLLRRVSDSDANVADGLLERDIDCFVRTYAPSRNAALLREETMDCPLVELDLLRETGPHAYQFTLGPKPTLPAEIFGYALLDYHATHHAVRSTIGVGECLYDSYSPGQAFKLDENSIVTYIQELERLTHGAISMDETAGIAQIYLHRRLDPFALLQGYYTGSEVMR